MSKSATSAGSPAGPLPGSDTCVKLSGYITAQFTGGNLNDQFNWGGSILSALDAAVDPLATAHADQRILVQGGDVAVPITNGLTGAPIVSATTTTTQIQNGVPATITTPGTQLILPNQQNNKFNRPHVGWTTRANFGFSFASNTAYGPLIGHFDINSENGNGFDNTGTQAYLNTGYLTWAGITAGKAQSFYSFTGGGDNWANIFSPDQKGFNEPDLMAYTASFGGGFSATIAAQSQGSNGGSGGGTNMTGAAGSNPGSITFGGQKWPDIVGALHVKQGWGEAQVSGVIHNVNVKDYNFNGDVGCGLLGLATPIETACNASEQKVGWGIDAGVKYNLNWWGAGDSILVTGSYTQNAVWYSGLPDGMWGENGQVNGNGQPMYLADAFFNPLTNSWSTPRAWSVTAIFEHHFTPQFYVDLEGSVGGIEWSIMGGGCNVLGFGCGIAQFGSGALSPHSTSWIIGADLGWNPVTNLNFDLELMYQDTTQERPSGFIGTVFNNGEFIPGAWQGNSNGFAGRFRITRYF
jgi:Porin subfamily